MSATKGKIPSKGSSSSSTTAKPTTTTVSPKAAPKPASKTLLNYFTKVTKDKTENDLNESNRKRKLSAESNHQRPVKILKPSDDNDVVVIDENSEPAISNPTEINDDSLESSNPVDENKPMLIKLTPINKKKKEGKIKNSKRKSKDPKADVLPVEEMEIDDVVAIESEETENTIDDKSESIVKVIESNKDQPTAENNEILAEKTDKVEKQLEVVEMQKEENVEKLSTEDKSKTFKTPRRRSTRIENSQEKIAEEIRNNVEGKVAKEEANPKKDSTPKTSVPPETEISLKKDAGNHEAEDDIKLKDKGKVLVNSENRKPDDNLIILDNNSDDGLSTTNSPSVNKNNMSNTLTTSAEKKLTPKQLKLQETRRKAREEREKKIQEDREKRQKEKEEQRKKEKEEKELKLKKEREEKEEQRKKEKAEKEEQRAKEREEKERKRLEEIQQKRKREEQKEEEKRKKEEERKKKEAEKEEEKREKEQDRLKKEQEKLEEEQKKKREADKFKRFFRNSIDQTNQPSTTSVAGGGTISISSSQGNDTSNHATETSSNFMPFCVKGNMKLAPCTRKTLTDDQKVELDKVIDGEKLKNHNSYLKELKSQGYAIGKSEKTIQNYEDDDIMIVDDELDTIGDEVVELKPKHQKYRAKFLLFTGNRRPPYYGTWRKKSTIVKPCKPFEMDTKYFNYEVDSDDEWEEDEPGESLKGSDDDYESNDDYEVDNEFFVPHGYLSDEENKAEMDGDGPDAEENDNHPSTQKDKLKILQQEFFAEHNKKTEKIKPKLIGCIWQNLNEDEIDDKYSAIIHKLLDNHAMILNTPIILKPETPPVDENQADTSIEFTNKDIQVLINLVHGNVNKRQFLVKEFLASRAEKLEAGKRDKLTQVKIMNKIREIADWKRCVTDNPIMNNRYCWVVGDKYLDEFNLSDLDVCNKWKYTLKPVRIMSTIPTTKEDSNDGATPSINTTTAASTTVVNSITKYTTPISKLEQNTESSMKPITTKSPKPTAIATKKSPIQKKPIVASTSSNSTQPTKKRINPLMSVPRGQTFPQNKKNTLISEYLNNGKLNNNTGNIVDSGKSKITENTSNPKTAEADETISMDCDVIQLE